jgi:hypothetical protein
VILLAVIAVILAIQWIVISRVAEKRCAFAALFVDNDVVFPP